MKKGKTSSATSRVLWWLISFTIVIIMAYLVIVGVLLYSVRDSANARITATDAEPVDDIFDLSSWSSEQLAAQMIIVMNPSHDPTGLYILAQKGVGGVVLSSDSPVPEIVDAIAGAQLEVPRGIRMFIASDEEGGQITRMQKLIGKLASPQTMGSWESDKITDTVNEYGKKLSKMGVNVAIAPVADLTVVGTYMAKHDRTFGADPDDVARCVVAWQEGMQSAGVAVAPKHWPGMGNADDTHVSHAVISPISQLEAKDMIPFVASFDSGVEMVMVGHAIANGLTEPDTPATISPKALAYLRKQVGKDVVILTDAMYMSATTDSLNISADEAVVQSAIAGADLVMSIHWQGDTIGELTRAIDSGRLPRQRAEESVLRILNLKAKMGLLDE